LRKRIQTPGKVIEFNLVIHEVNAPKELLISQGFYENYGRLPIGSHFEIEVIGFEFDPAIDDIIHITDGVDGRKFIYYPRQITSLKKAISVAHFFCLGTAYSVVNDDDFQCLASFAEPARFLKELKDVFGIYELE